MIIFLKKIRDKFSANNNPLKYFKYAVGEIILIVIGILFAMQLKSVAIKRQNKFVEYEILIDLKSEFNSNLQELEKAIRISNNIVLNSETLLRACWDDNHHISSDSINILVGKSILYSEQEFKYHNSVQLELINTGKQSMIKNKAIRRFISSWNSQLELVKYQEKVVDNFRHKVIDIFLALGNSSILVYDNSFSKLVNNSIRSNVPLLESMQFENALSLYSVTSNHLSQKKYTDIKENISEINDLINQSLKNNPGKK